MYKGAHPAQLRDFSSVMGIENGNDSLVVGVGDWTDWSSCTQNGFESRSQACEYGRKIQRRGCPARQPLQSFGAAPPAPPQPYPRREPVAQSRSDQSPYDEYARRYLERLSQQREPQRHPASQQAQPCVQGICPAPQPPQYSALQESRPQEYRPPQPRPEEARYRPAPPPPPACNGDGCVARNLVHGTWYDWSEWSECSCTCGIGMKQRRRECMTNNCQGPEYETAPCDMGPCETWSEWCEWTACSGSCGRGERSRTRYCNLGTQRCEGKDYEVEACDAGPCPEWANWAEWGRCSVSCGTGRTRRQRTCLGGVQEFSCPGPSTEERVCEELPCSLWSPWQDWSSCSASCGNGMKRRVRTCQYGTDCPGPAEEAEPCYGPPCAMWTQWCEWSGCSAQCGPGHRTRTRSCLTADGMESRDCPGQSIETTLCEGTSCCRWSDWCAWSMCDRECGTGHSIRTRACVNSEGIIDPICHCEGIDREQKQCNTQPCALQCAWTQWCAWSECTTRSQCEIGIQSRSRQCVGEPGCHCLGLAEENQQCRGQIPCSTKAPC
ncbi:hypothetical protein Y032_0076g1065 [Ancylostoma ceylanicum]|uniref:Thrombospondin type 1 domain protein n=2 Tax=Ancylostoma ceylanicum TaxID=53326 RepID=A0A016TUK4_9BILA|nr:hypothetical protein Y032_0076g1065 [Ancylostoma ceylanicum]